MHGSIWRERLGSSDAHGLGLHMMEHDDTERSALQLGMAGWMPSVEEHGPSGLADALHQPDPRTGLSHMHAIHHNGRQLREDAYTFTASITAVAENGSGEDVRDLLAGMAGTQPGISIPDSDAAALVYDTMRGSPELMEVVLGTLEDAPQLRDEVERLIADDPDVFANLDPRAS